MAAEVGHEDPTWSSWPIDESQHSLKEALPTAQGSGVGGWEGARKEGWAHKMQNQMPPIWGQMPSM